MQNYFGHSIENHSNIIEGTHVVIFFQAVYGVLSGLEGLDAFQDLMTNTSMKPWYDRVETAVQTHAGAHTV